MKALKRPDERVVAVRVPLDEMLISQYEPWAESILYGVCVGCDSRFGDCGHERSARRVSWERVFQQPVQEFARMQAIVDRLEPDWFLGIEVVQP